MNPQPHAEDYYLWPARGDRRRGKRKGAQYRFEERVFKVLILVALAAALAITLSGCATVPDLDLQAHEERHCEGWRHQEPVRDGRPFRYEWTRTRPESAKPWIYAYVDNPDTTCRMLGSDLAGNIVITGCAIWQPANCIIILPK